MAAKLLSINGSPASSGYREYICDSESDIALLPKYKLSGNINSDTSDTVSNDSCAIGSIAYICDTMEFWVLSPSNKWVKFI